MPPQQIGNTNMYEIPADEEFVTSQGERIPGGGPARLENEFKDYPKPGQNTYRVQYRGKKFDVVAQTLSRQPGKLAKKVLSL